MKRLENNFLKKGILGYGILGEWNFEKRGFWVKKFGKGGFSAKEIL